MVLDFSFCNSELECQVDRLNPTNAPGQWLQVSWNAIKCPPGYEQLGEGVVFVKRPSGYERRKYRAKPDILGDNQFQWRDTVKGEGAMVVLILPAGHIIPSVDDAKPLPTLSKVFNNRMAVYWFIKEDNLNRVKVSWRLETINQQSISDHCFSFNEEANNRSENPNVMPVMIVEENEKVKKFGTTVVHGDQINIGDVSGVSGQFAIGSGINQTQLSVSDKKDLLDALMLFRKDLHNLGLSEIEQSIVAGNVAEAIMETKKEKPDLPLVKNKLQRAIDIVKTAGSVIEKVAESPVTKKIVGILGKVGLSLAL